MAAREPCIGKDTDDKGKKEKRHRSLSAPQTHVPTKGKGANRVAKAVRLAGRSPPLPLRGEGLGVGVGAGSYTTRSTIIFLISEIALAGFNPLGQVLAQFMIVWQR